MTVLPIETSSTLFWTTNDLKSLYEIRLGRRYALSTCWTSRTAHRPRMRYPNESLIFFFSPSITAKTKAQMGAGLRRSRCYRRQRLRHGRVTAAARTRQTRGQNVARNVKENE